VQTELPYIDAPKQKHPSQEQLTAVRGIGNWTAQMFMMFTLHLPDVLPLGDLGVRNGIAKHFGACRHRPLLPSSPTFQRAAILCSCARHFPPCVPAADWHEQHLEQQGRLSRCRALDVAEIGAVLDGSGLKGHGKRGSLHEVKDGERCRELLAPFRPYRSLVSWYMWRALETESYDEAMR
jgi:3-methyladenine DNA glycosylase/8-oxoguanine DNA glycosylase